MWCRWRKVADNVSASKTLLADSFSGIRLRNNKETYLDGSADDIIQQVEHRIARYTFLPTANGEPLHVMQYLPGQGYGAAPLANQDMLVV